MLHLASKSPADNTVYINRRGLVPWMSNHIPNYIYTIDFTYQGPGTVKTRCRPTYLIFRKLNICCKTLCVHECIFGARFARYRRAVALRSLTKAVAASSSPRLLLPSTPAGRGKVPQQPMNGRGFPLGSVRFSSHHNAHQSNEINICRTL